jgi:hypothetical protein
LALGLGNPDWGSGALLALLQIALQPRRNAVTCPFPRVVVVVANQQQHTKALPMGKDPNKTGELSRRSDLLSGATRRLVDNVAHTWKLTSTLEASTGFTGAEPWSL